MNRGIPISEQEADKLLNEGVASLFDLPSCSCGGYFEAGEGARRDIVIIVTDEAFFIRASEDLIKSKDGVFVGFVEDGEDIPNLEDIFEIRRF